jgi:hypothetical protein
MRNGRVWCGVVAFLSLACGDGVDASVATESTGSGGSTGEATSGRSTDGTSVETGAPETGSNATTESADSTADDGGTTTDLDGTSSGFDQTTDASGVDGSTSEGSAETGSDDDDGGAGILEFETAYTHSAKLNYSGTPFVLADFDGDGFMDAAVHDTADDTINVLMNDGTGRLEPAIENPVPDAGPIAAGDVDEDGIADIVVVDGYDVHVLLGLGDGTFSVALTLPHTVSFSPWLGDLDGDGHLDLVARSSSTVRILIGDGTGDFEEIGSYAFGSTPALAVLDVDGDGHLDLAAYSGSSALVRLGDGTGAFGSQISNPMTWMGVAHLGRSKQIYSIGDINGDGHGDVATDDTNGVTILLGDAQGGLTEIIRYAARYPTVADFDEDGHVDLMLENPNQPGLVALRFGQGDGTFGSPIDYTIGVGHSGVGTGADMDLDGTIDAVHATDISVKFGRGDGTLAMPRVSRPGNQPRALARGDFDGDAYPDFAVTLEGASSVATLLGQPDGRFVVGSEVVLGVAPQAVAVGDVDEDGHLDVLWGRATGQGGILLGDGSGGLQAGASLAGGGRPVALADLDGDQHLDAIAAFGDDLRVSLGDGTGTFSTVITTLTDGNLQSMVVFDADGDAFPDLAVASWNGSIAVLLGNGDGTFSTSHTIVLASHGVAVDHGDFDGDGNEDLVYVEHMQLGAIGVALGNGDGTFAAPTTWGPYAGQAQADLAVEDFDGDGVLDIAARIVSPFVDVLVGVGDGTFVHGRRHPMSWVTRIVASDQDLDGKPDIVACHFIAGQPGFISTMRNATK